MGYIGYKLITLREGTLLWGLWSIGAVQEKTLSGIGIDRRAEFT
jgi:hypothetical protein